MERAAREILTVNTGSSSIKFSIYPVGLESPVVRGRVEDIGGEVARLRLTDRDGQVLKDEPVRVDGFREGAALVAEILHQTDHSARIAATGYRVVHGGRHYRAHTVVDHRLMEHLKGLVELAPEHLPQTVEVMERLEDEFNHSPAVACFDTVFHRDMPEHWRIYAIPYRFYEEGIMRYGFHGLSYEYVAEELGREGVATDRVVVAHLGHGASMAAISDGRCVYTTMGFTPVSGLVMSTRCGDIDPGVVLHLIKEKGLSVDELNHILNHRSGLLGISGLTDDIRRLLPIMEENPRAGLAIEVFCQSVRLHIGALAALLGGLSTLVFTAGIGENSPPIRERILEGLEFIGIGLDKRRNNANQRIISADDSAVKVMVIPTDEELMIARHTRRILKL